MDKTKVKKWVYISCITAVVLVWLVDLAAIMMFEEGRLGFCNFVNDFLSSMNLSFRVSVDSISSVYEFITRFGFGLIFPATLHAGRKNNISKKWTSKRWNLICLCLFGVLWSIPRLSSNIFLYFAINLIGYTFGVLVYWLLNSENKEKDVEDIKDELAVNKLKAENWVYIFYVIAMIFIGLFNTMDGQSEVRNFLNNLLSSMNLSFRVSLDDVEYIFSFIICFGFGLIFPACLRSGRENNVSKKWTSKKWNIIWLCLLGLILSIPTLISGRFLPFVINLVGYIFGIFVDWLLHLKKKIKTSILKKFKK